MCSVDAPDPVEIEKPTFVRNPFLDDDTNDVRSADALRRGRSSLVIPTGQGIGFAGRGGSGRAGDTGNPNGNGRFGSIGGLGISSGGNNSYPDVGGGGYSGGGGGGGSGGSNPGRRGGGGGRQTQEN